MKYEMDINQDYLVRNMVREQLILGSSTRSLDALNEGLAMDLAKDAVQFALGAAAEYGIGGAITVGTFGAGAPAGAVAETAVDAAFAAKDVASGVDAVISNIKSAGEMAGMLNDAVKNFGGDFGDYYAKLKKIIQDGLAKITKGDYSKIDEIIDSLKEKIQEIISAIVSPIEKGIKLVIPDASIGLAAAKAVGQAIKSLSENAYSAITSAIESVDMLNDAITNPQKVVDFFDDILSQIADKLVEVGEYFREMSWAKAIIFVGPASGTLLKKLGPKGMENLSQKVKDATPKIMDIISAVLTKVMPAMFACLGIYQIIIKGEYKKEDSEDKKEDSEDKKNEALIREYARSLAQLSLKSSEKYSTKKRVKLLKLRE